MRRHALTLAVGAALVAIALDGGGFSVGSRVVLHAVVVAGILAALASGAFVQSRTAAVASLALAALALVAVLSATWAQDPETALAEGARWALYASAFVLAAGTLRRRDAPAVADGLALGIVAVAVIALTSRALPGLLDPGALPHVVPEVKSRLSYPLQYWNGLGLLLAAGVPLLIGVIADPSRSVARVVAVPGLGAVVTGIYLTSSRGAVAMAALAIVAFGVFDGRPLAAVRARASRRALVAAGAVAAVLAVAALVALDPAQRWDRFTAPPNEAAAAADAPGFIATHLASGGGSGRWQFWSAAVDQFQAHPLAGGGAGSYEAWWAQHGTLAQSIRDAHALGLQTLAELGLLGAVLLVAFTIVALAGAARGAMAARATRPAAASLVAAAIAVLAGTQIDWSWNLPAVAIVALVALATLLTAETAPARARIVSPAIAVAAIVGLGASLLPWLTSAAIDDSRAAVGRGDLQGALDRALAARALEPWASSPRVQEALIRERAGDMSGAARAIAGAVKRDPDDWRIRLVAARIQTAAGDPRAADVSLRRAQQLAPRYAVTAAGRSR